MALCLRFLNFCVLIALGGLFLAPVPRLDRSIDARLPGQVLHPSAYSFLSDTGRDRFIAKLAVVKEDIHTNVCHHRGLFLLRSRGCGPASDS